MAPSIPNNNVLITMEWMERNSTAVEQPVNAAKQILNTNI